MGKQIRFYMHTQDEEEFVKFVLQKSTVKILRVISQDQNFMVEPKSFLNTSDLHQVFFWDSSIGPFSTHISRHFRKRFDKAEGTYVETGDIFFTFDKTNSPVIEYTRSFIRTDGKLTQGRLWADTNRLIDNELVKKDQKFIRWYDEIANWIRRNSKKNNNINDAYILKRTWEWCLTGGKLKEPYLENLGQDRT
jgi:hypothetical protein